MNEFIRKNIKGQKVLFLFIITNLVYVFMLLVTIPKVMNFSNGMRLLDMLPTGYNVEYVNSLFDTLGEKGREIYLFNQIPIDMIYPFLFGISYCLVLAYFFQKLGKLNGYFLYLCLLPVVAGIFDYLENTGIIAMLINYPDLSKSLITTTNIFTIFKSVFTTVYFVILIITLIVVIIKYIKGKIKH